MTSGMDHAALIDQFAQASSKQAASLRKAVQEATLKAMQGRELSLKSIRSALQTVAGAVSTGLARNAAIENHEALLGKVVDGMDAAVMQAVEANRRTLQQLIDHGATLRDGQFKKALADIERMESALFDGLNKAAADASATLQAPWAQALSAYKDRGTGTGINASAAVEQLTQQAQAAHRAGRQIMQRSAQAMLDHYAAVASGVLVGMTDAFSGSLNQRKGSKTGKR